MPVMGGVEAAAILKQEQPSTPVVLITASTDDATLDACRNSGADDIMPKPFNCEMLALLLEQVALYVLPVLCCQLRTARVAQGYTCQS